MIPDYKSIQHLDQLVDAADKIQTQTEDKVYNFTNKAMAQEFSECLAEFGILGKTGNKKYVAKHINEEFGVVLTKEDMEKIKSITDPIIHKSLNYNDVKIMDDYYPKISCLKPIEIVEKSDKFKWNNNEIESNYKDLMINKKIYVHRNETDFIEKVDRGGVANVGYDCSFYPNSKVGVMIAANSGLPGGALGKRPDHITKKDLAMTTQEEAVWANAVLTFCGEDKPREQEAFHAKTIQGQWGMQEKDGLSTSTIQGIDFTKTENPNDYNETYIVDHCYLTAVNDKKELEKDKDYPVVFVFADSINANPGIGTKTGTMQRTLNQKAINDYDFFRDCVKMKLRSALDAMVFSGVTHPLVAQLSCGIYAGKHQPQIRQDFNNILQEVLDEKVGPNGEKRGQFFEQVILPKISAK